MHLKTIKIRGFKSFPELIEVRLEPGVAVVVGPNGSGKSNIADAIVWAAGSLTPSELRAEKPDDVLFAGGGDRPPSDSCEVELLFDNTSGDGPLEYSELAVTRRLHRGGEGQYLLNRVAVRRTDLVDLISDLGLGHGMHSIIGQGRVDEVLVSKPHERRALIEEAAGLAKFKRRRHRAELKLARVRGQVERALDVEMEVKKRLRPLALQASAAERAEKLRLQIASLQARIGELELAEVSVRRGDADGRRSVVHGEQDEIRVQLERLLAERERAEEELADVAGKREAALQSLYRLRGVGERIDLRRETCEELLAQLRDDLEQAETWLSEAGRTRLAELEESAACAQREAEHLAAERDRCKRQMSERWCSLAALEQVAATEIGSRLGALLGEREALEERLTAAVSEPGSTSAARLRIGGALERLSLRRESLTALAGDLELELAEAQARAARPGPTIEELESVASQAAVRAHEAALERDRLRSSARDAGERLIALERALAEREGIPPAARALAEAGERLALSLLEVEPGYEQATAAALAWRAAAVLASDPERALELLEQARRDGLGRLAVVLARDERAPTRAPVARARPLADFVAGDETAKALVAGIWLSEREQLAQARDGVLVTREGFGYDAGRGELWFAGETAEAFLLELDARRRALVLEKDELARLLVEAEKTAAESAREAERARVALAKVEPFARRRLPAPALLSEAIRLTRRIEQALLNVVTSGDRFDEPLRRRSEEGQHAAASLGEELRALRGEEAELRSLLVDTGERLSAALRHGGIETVATAPIDLTPEVVPERRAALEAEIATLEADLEQAEREAERSAELVRVARGARSEAIGRGTRRIDPAIARRAVAICLGLSEGLEVIPAQALRIETPLREQVEAGATSAGELGNTLRRLGAKEAAVRGRMSEASERLAAIDVEIARLEAEAESAQARIAACQSEPAEGEDREELLRSLERGERRLEELGRVNPLAHEEYEAEKARLEELTVQRGDLERSLEELERLRTELIETVERRFAETFEAVSATFDEVAATLFPGGEGRLRLTEPGAEAGDEEEAGIEIELRPAGKRITKLSLLSGGEKALGAIAFLFALFLAHPCPFYLLDEVEAALDDANIGRFVELLRRYADQAQFLVVTHQKRTMEAADILYGVTMGGDGTSQVISRRAPREREPALASA